MRRLLRLSCDFCLRALQRGQSVSVYSFPWPFRFISWSIVVLLYFLPLLYVDLCSRFLLVLIVLVFSVALK